LPCETNYLKHDGCGKSGDNGIGARQRWSMIS
jgi:hypothetical protein